MKRIEYNKEKDNWLKKNRGVSFEDVISVIKTQKILDTLINPNKKKYINQRMYIVKFKDYVYAVPFVEDDEKIFLKTIYPTRKYKNKYLKGEKNEK